MEASRRLSGNNMTGFLEAMFFFAIFCMLGLLMWTSMIWLVRMVKRQVTQVKWTHTTGPFYTKYGYSFDAVLVVPIHEANEVLTPFQKEFTLQKILRKLVAADIDTQMFFSVQQDEVYIKIRAPIDRLKEYADKINYKVILHPFALLNRLHEGYKRDGQWVWLPINIEDTKKQCCYSETEFIYGKYSAVPELQDVYHNVNLPEGRVFRGVDRLKLLMGILEQPTSMGGCGLSVSNLIYNKALVAFFPLHDYDELRSLQSEWIVTFQWPSKQPLETVRNYMGEKITLYFAWLGCYTSWLLYAGIAGLITFIDVAVEGDNFDAFLVGPFAVFMAVWSTAFLEEWGRRQASYAMMWGMVDFEQEETVRADFKGEVIQSPVDGEDMLYFPEAARRPMIFRSRSMIASMTTSVLGIVSGMLVLKYFISGGGPNTVNPHVHDVKFGPIITAILNAIQIQFMGELFTGYAERLTLEENHRTDTDFEDSLIAKSFGFNFVNAYMSLFYIGFLSRLFGFDCNDTDNDCMAALNYQLGTIFCARLLIGNITEIVIPLVENSKSELANKVEGHQREELASSINEAVSNALLTNATFHPHVDESEEVKGEGEVGLAHVDVPQDAEEYWSVDKVLRPTAIEEQFVLGEYDQQLDLFSDYLEMVIQFGYATLFSCAFSLAPILAYVSNYIEIRVDAWKLTMAKRRPMPRGAEDIGTWQDIMDSMSVISVVTNFAIICFASNILEHYTGKSNAQMKVMCFIVFEHIALAIKYSIKAIIDDVPPEVQIQLQRQELFCSKVLDNHADEESDITEYVMTVEKGVVEASTDPPVLSDVTIYSTDKEWVLKHPKKKKKKDTTAKK